MFENEKLLSKMPHWCGTCNGNRTWEVYEKYLNKLVRKKYGKEKKVVSNLPVNTPIAAPEINW